MQLIKGTEVAEKVLAECRRDIAVLLAQGKTPGLAVVLGGRRTKSAKTSACTR